MVGLGAFHADRYPHEFSGGRDKELVSPEQSRLDPHLS